MGANAITTISIGVLLMALSFYFAPDSFHTIGSVLRTVGIPEDHVLSILHFLKLSDDADEKQETKSTDHQLVTLLTPEELQKFDGSPNSKGLYLAILGEIFDVEKGAQHYKPGGGYAFFTGKDATRAYVTGDFSEAGLVDDVSGLDDSTLLGIEDWLSFYREEYNPVGNVIGRYYDGDGKPTKEFERVRAKIERVRRNKWLEDNEKQLFPPCNSEWSKTEGSKVWCTNKSGGIDRNWIGVPRQLKKAGKDPRCVCVKNSGPSSALPDEKEHDDRGDLDHPDLKEYPNCKPTSQSCEVDHP